MKEFVSQQIIQLTWLRWWTDGWVWLFSGLIGIMFIWQFLLLDLKSNKEHRFFIQNDLQNTGSLFKTTYKTVYVITNKVIHINIFRLLNRVFSLNFWWGGLNFFGSLRSPSGTKSNGGELTKKSPIKSKYPP